MNRDDFLKRVAEAARQGQRYRVRPTVKVCDSSHKAQIKLCEQFCNELQMLKVEYFVSVDEQAAVETMEALLKQEQPKRVDVSDHTLANRNQYVEIVTSLGAKTIESSEESLAADVSITGVDWAVSNTGTLVLCCGQDRSRVSPIGAACHIAVVYAHQIVADLNDLIPLWQRNFGEPEQWPANILMITGPSKTGDIEMKLTRGVHGPGRLMVLVVG